MELATTPGVIGGLLSGVVHVPKPIRPERGYKLKLNCINRTVTGSGKNKSVKESVMWEDECHLAREILEHDFTQTAIPVLFGVPYEAQPTNTENRRNQILWRLEVVAEMSGVDYKETFDVPVHMTPESNPNFVPDMTPLQPYLSELSEEDQLSEGGIMVTTLASGEVNVSFPALRFPQHLLIGIVFVVVWFGITIFMWHTAPRFVTVLYALIGLLVGGSILRSQFFSSNIRASRDRVELMSSVGFGTRRRNWSADELVGFTPGKGVQSGSKNWYRLHLNLKNGKKMMVGNGIPGFKQAATIANRLNMALEILPPDVEKNPEI